jgi:hypothetical protein
VGVQVDLRRGEVRTLAEASDGVGVVAVMPQPTRDGLPAPAPQPPTNT